MILRSLTDRNKLLRSLTDRIFLFFSSKDPLSAVLVVQPLIRSSASKFVVQHDVLELSGCQMWLEDVKSSSSAAPPHRDDFRRRRRCITSSIKNTVATPGPPRSPSSTHHLLPSRRFVWSNVIYWTRNWTIPTIKYLLHGSHSGMKQEWLKNSQCKLILT